MYTKPKTVRAAQRRIARHMALGRQRGRPGNPTGPVCAACGAPWDTSSPGDCKACGRFAYAVSR